MKHFLVFCLTFCAVDSTFASLTAPYIFTWFLHCIPREYFWVHEILACKDCDSTKLKLKQQGKKVQESLLPQVTRDKFYTGFIDVCMNSHWIALKNSKSSSSTKRYIWLLMVSLSRMEMTKFKTRVMCVMIRDALALCACM